MQMQIINGYVCLTTTDVTLAEDGKNPAHPNADPLAPVSNLFTSQTGASTSSGSGLDVTTSGSQNPPAVTFGGSLSHLNDQTSSAWSSTDAQSGTGSNDQTQTRPNSGSGFNVLI